MPARHRSSSMTSSLSEAANGSAAHRASRGVSEALLIPQFGALQAQIRIRDAAHTAKTLTQLFCRVSSLYPDLISQSGTVSVHSNGMKCSGGAVHFKSVCKHEHNTPWVYFFFPHLCNSTCFQLQQIQIFLQIRHEEHIYLF